MYQNPNGEPQVVLYLAVKEMNDTLGTEGLVLSALAFGEFTQSTQGPNHLRNGNGWKIVLQ